MARRNVDKEDAGEERGGGGRGQTFYSGISNGAAKSPCNFLSARGGNAYGGIYTTRASARGHVIGRKRQKYAPIGRPSG